MSQQLKSQNIIGDVIDDVEETASIHINYGKLGIHQGGTYSPESCIDAPTVKLTGITGASHQFTLLMVDPDAPDPDEPVNAEWLHWLVTNIPGGDGESDPRKGTEVVPYLGPAPPTGVHRYVFLLYQQASRVNVDLKEVQGRKKFNTRMFAKQHGLSSNPVAATFFLSHKTKK